MQELVFAHRFASPGNETDEHKEVRLRRWEEYRTTLAGSVISMHNEENLMKPRNTARYQVFSIHAYTNQYQVCNKSASPSQS